MGGDLRVGVVGCGARGGLARLAHAPGRGSRVVGVCEPVPRRQDAAREALDTDGSLAVVPDLDALLGLGLDSVMVLTPDDLHAPVALATLAAGVPTFCEKPLATTTADCDAVLRAAREHRTRLYVGHNMRHMPVVRQMKALVDGGAIGTVAAAGPIGAGVGDCDDQLPGP